MDRLRTQLKVYLDDLVATSQLPGYAIGVNMQGSEITLSGGRTAIDQARAPDPHTRFAVYSVTKAVTALAALRLVQEGRLALDGTVSDYLDGWSDPGKDSAITITHLISHTAGFTYGSRTGSVAEAYRRAGFIRTSPRSMQPLDMYREFSKLPRLYPPGEGWSYSLASDVLGWVLSEVTSATLAQALRREVFDPLGMGRTCLQSELAQDGDIATIYARGSSEWVSAEAAMADWGNVTAPQSGGASMVTTLCDIMKLASSYVRESPEYLSADLWKFAKSNLIPGGRSLRSGVLSPLPGRAVDGVGFGASVAVVIDGPAAGVPLSVGEVGWEGSTGCFFLANRELGLCCGFMSNVYPHGGMPWWSQLRRLIYQHA